MHEYTANDACRVTYSCVGEWCNNSENPPTRFVEETGVWTIYPYGYSSDNHIWTNDVFEGQSLKSNVATITVTVERLNANYNNQVRSKDIHVIPVSTIVPTHC